MKALISEVRTAAVDAGSIGVIGVVIAKAEIQTGLRISIVQVVCTREADVPASPRNPT